MKRNKIRFIDLFAGIGGTRLGFELACTEMGIVPECVFTSEIKPFAIQVYQQNFSDSTVCGDITKIKETEIPSFDFLLAGFPCQAFSAAGSRKGFLDTRGTLFFEIERILAAKQPQGFLLENVEGLVNHDQLDRSAPYGRTLETILEKLTGLGYYVSWKVLNASDFGVPQNRKRIYIIGSKTQELSLDNFLLKRSKLSSVLEQDLKCMESPFVDKLLKHFTLGELHGKSIKDKRGGDNNIHSWDIEIKGKTTKEQRKLLSALLKQRRQKKWAESKGIKWMDGMPLTLREIKTFYPHSKLKEMLDDLVKKGYLTFEHPKDVVTQKTADGKVFEERKYAKDKEKGYNIVTGKLSFEISKILDPNDIAPTLVATDVTRMAVPDKNGLRRLTVREGLRLSGFPESYKIDGIKYDEAFDLLGNTVIVTVIKELSLRSLGQLYARKRLVA